MMLGAFKNRSEARDDRQDNTELALGALEIDVSSKPSTSTYVLGGTGQVL